MPFWTVCILLAGRMSVPRELYEAAAVDGANGLHRFEHVTLPLMANLYVVCILLDSVFTLGDFNSTDFVSGRRAADVHGGAGHSGAHPLCLHQRATASRRGDCSRQPLPLLAPLVFLLMQPWLRMNDVQL